MAYAEPDPVDEKGLDRLNPDLDAPDRRSRVEAAIALKIAGANYSEIADALEYSSVEQARSAVERGLAATAGEEDRRQLREISGRRLERLLRGLWTKATDPEDPEHLSATRTALALIDRHIRLFGQDAPSEMIVYAPGQAEIENWVAEMASHLRAAQPQEVDIIEGEVVEDEPKAG